MQNTKGNGFGGINSAHTGKDTKKKSIIPALRGHNALLGVLCVLVVCLVCFFSPARASSPTPSATPTPQITPVPPLFSNGRMVYLAAPPAMQTATATEASGAALSLELPAIAGMTTELYGFDLTCANPAAAAENGTLTITGAAGQTLTYEVVESSAAGANIDRHFAPLPAAAVGGNISFALGEISSGSSCALNVEYGFAD